MVLQTLESVYTRGAWKEESAEGLQSYLRVYVVDKYENDLSIFQIALVTLGCCGGLIAMVVAFWSLSKPTERDRIINYLSSKHARKERRKSSLAAGTHMGGTSLVEGQAV